MDDNELLASHEELCSVLRATLREFRTVHLREPPSSLLQRIRDVLTDAVGVTERYRAAEAEPTESWEVIREAELDVKDLE
jgi:hypothetical protein